MLWALPLLWAHGSSYNTTQISVLPGTTEAWAVVEGWGVIHTQDGRTWEWICEESIGVLATYDVLALSAGVAVAATSDGLYVLDGCGSTPVAGLPDGAQVGLVAQSKDGFYAAVSAADRAGIYVCTLAGCSVVTEGLSPDRFLVRSLISAEGKVYATILHEQSYVIELVVSTGGTFTRLAEWSYDSEDVRVLGARDDQVFVWSQPRTSAAVPALLVSQDAGKSFSRTFETGTYQDVLPGFALVGEEIFISSYLGRTWCSRDFGGSFVEVSETAPLIRCADEDGLGNSYVCTDHFADGFDIARTPLTGSRTWEPVSCLDQTQLAACQQTACGELYFTFTTFGGSTAGVCNATEEVASEPSERRCGCGSKDSAAAGLLFISLFPGLWRIRRKLHPISPSRH